jgi:hypothetical protein
LRWTSSLKSPVKATAQARRHLELIEDLRDAIPLAKGKKATRRKQMKSSGHDEKYFGRQQDEERDGDQHVVQPNIKFASLNEQSLFHGYIPDDDPIDHHDVEVGRGSPEKLAAAIEGLVSSGYISKWYTEFATVGDRVHGCFQAQAGRRPFSEFEASCHQTARQCRTRAYVSSQIRSDAAEVKAC